MRGDGFIRPPPGMSEMRTSLAIAAVVVIAVAAITAFFLWPRRGGAGTASAPPFDMGEILRNETLHIVVGTSEPYLYQDMGFTITVLRFNSVRWGGLVWTHRAVLVEPMGVSSDAAAIVVAEPDEANDRFLEMFGLRAAAEAGVPVLLLYDLPPGLTPDGKLSAVLQSIQSLGPSGSDEDFLLHAMAAAIMRAATLVNTVSPAHPTRFVVSGRGISGWAAAVAAAADPRIVAVQLRDPVAWDLRSGGGCSPEVLEAVRSISDEAQERILRSYNPVGLLDAADLPVMISVDAVSACEVEGALRSERATTISIVPGEIEGFENATLAQASAAWRAFLKYVIVGSPLPEIGELSVNREGDIYRVSIRVSGNGAVVRNVNLWYVSAEGGWKSARMETADGETFTCEIPVGDGGSSMYASVWFTIGGSDGLLSSQPVCGAP